jgi:hypothetical protein
MASAAAGATSATVRAATSAAVLREGRRERETQRNCAENSKTNFQQGENWSLANLAGAVHLTALPKAGTIEGPLARFYTI